MENEEMKATTCKCGNEIDAKNSQLCQDCIEKAWEEVDARQQDAFYSGADEEESE